MKSKLVLILVLLSTVSHASPLRKAQFTRVLNDVKVVPEQQSPLPAKVGDSISGKTAVTTGVQSRAELKFEDNTLTRLGANSAFSLDEGSRTVDLKQGTLLLQVPKQLGGAKVRTAAITAAVTGTTVLVEYEPNGYVKLIVLEGTMDVFRNDKPSVFTTITAGDMLIMKPNGKEMPAPVQVDLKRLKGTSKLLNQDFGALGNQKYLDNADKQQTDRLNNGELQETSLIVKENLVFIDTDKVIDLLPGVSIKPVITPVPTPSPPTAGGKFGIPPLLGGVAVIDNTTEINTDPLITTAFEGTVGTGQGRIFRPGTTAATDQNIGHYLFGAATNLVGDNVGGGLVAMDYLLARQGYWTTFRFDELHVIGAPTIATLGGPQNLILASNSTLTLCDVDPFNSLSTAVGNWDLSKSGLKNVAFMAADTIDWQNTYSVTGTTQNVFLYTQSLAPVTTMSHTLSGLANPGDIYMTGSYTSRVSLTGGMFTALAGNDLTLSGTPTVAEVAPPNAPVVAATNVNLGAVRDVNLSNGATVAASQQLNIVANRGISITDSSQLRQLSLADPLVITMLACTGDVNMVGASLNSGRVSLAAQQAEITSQSGNVNIQNADLSADVLRVHTLGTNGQLIIGGSNLTATQALKLYAEGSNGMVEFVANSSLNGPTTIAGKTVQVDNGVSVNINDPIDFRVHADNQNFNGGAYGNFTTGGSPINFVPPGNIGPQKGSFASRPGF